MFLVGLGSKMGWVGLGWVGLGWVEVSQPKFKDGSKMG